MSVVVPFFPFTSGERAVMAHKYLLDLRDTFREPIGLKAKKLVRHSDLQIQNDGQLCMSLTEKW